jgi:L-alanine-DL-glutamate epimerase-like enolase superfamily enzyme
MTITNVEAIHYRIPLREAFATSVLSLDSLGSVLVRVETADGVVGYGETTPAWEVTGETQESVLSVVETVLAPRLLGESPLAIERLDREMRAVADEAPSARMAVELALQDVRGRVAGLPLSVLLGGDPAEDTVVAPAVVSIKEPSAMAADASAAVEAGYEQVKIKLGGDPATDRERVRAVAEVLPPDVSLKGDANQGWGDAKTALSVLDAVGHHLDVVEQPVHVDSVDDLVFLRDRLSTPVMPDETVGDAADARTLIEAGAGDIYNVKLAKTGGIRGAVELDAVAAAAGRATQLGSMVEGDVATAAGVHFVLARENVIWNEMVAPFFTEAGVGDLTTDEPRVTVSGPGLGVDVDEDRLADLAVERRVVSE